MTVLVPCPRCKEKTESIAILNSKVKALQMAVAVERETRALYQGRYEGALSMATSVREQPARLPNPKCKCGHRLPDWDRELQEQVHPVDCLTCDRRWYLAYSVDWEMFMSEDGAKAYGGLF